jgi:hypothetical protein
VGWEHPRNGKRTPEWGGDARAPARALGVCTLERPDLMRLLVGSYADKSHVERNRAFHMMAAINFGQSWLRPRDGIALQVRRDDNDMYRSSTYRTRPISAIILNIDMLFE